MPVDFPIKLNGLGAGACGFISGSLWIKSTLPARQI
jgi:hypothetical protein